MPISNMGQAKVVMLLLWVQAFIYSQGIFSNGLTIGWHVIPTVLLAPCEPLSYWRPPTFPCTLCLCISQGNTSLCIRDLVCGPGTSTTTTTLATTTMGSTTTVSMTEPTPAAPDDSVDNLEIQEENPEYSDHYEFLLNNDPQQTDF